MFSCFSQDVVPPRGSSVRAVPQSPLPTSALMSSAYPPNNVHVDPVSKRWCKINTHSLHTAVHEGPASVYLCWGSCVLNALWWPTLTCGLRYFSDSKAFISSSDHRTMMFVCLLPTVFSRPKDSCVWILKQPGLRDVSSSCGVWARVSTIHEKLWWF